MPRGCQPVGHSLAQNALFGSFITRQSFARNREEGLSVGYRVLMAPQEQSAITVPRSLHVHELSRLDVCKQSQRKGPEVCADDCGETPKVEAVSVWRTCRLLFLVMPRGGFWLTLISAGEAESGSAGEQPAKE